MNQAAEAAGPPSTWLGAQLRRGIVAERGLGPVVSLLLIPAILATNLIYDLLNHGPNRIFLETPLDRALPVVPIFAIPYISLIPYIGVSLLLFLFFRVRVYRSAALTMIIVWFISYAFYFFLQSYIARPHINGSDPFSGMIRTIYASDQPYNDFPSLHTSLSMIIAIHWWRFDRRIGIAAAIWTALIVASTVLVKQHYLADVAGGLVLAGVTSGLLMRVTRAS
ncbi:MAG TPA: phosphatase PAP2 family protein [Candidatus Saccharimonadales bacterium]|nr:phosphatase PAP2 family protein [Candidatus Saccharimonadales bacterium]